MPERPAHVPGPPGRSTALAPRRAVAPPRWYVRGPSESHTYDRAVPILGEYAGQAFCKTCLIVHKVPVGHDWHIEAPEVDRTACGIFISLDEGESRKAPPKKVCPRCAELSKTDEEDE